MYASGYGHQYDFVVFEVPRFLGYIYLYDQKGNFFLGAKRQFYWYLLMYISATIFVRII